MIKNKFLNYGDYKVKCVIGKRGISSFKKEGDLTTPRGKFKIKGFFYRKDNIYDLILILNYNMDPVKKNKGSAIFIHVAKKKMTPTKGCLAIKKIDLLKLLKLIEKKTLVKII